MCLPAAHTTALHGKLRPFQPGTFRSQVAGLDVMQYHPVCWFCHFDFQRIPSRHLIMVVPFLPGAISCGCSSAHNSAFVHSGERGSMTWDHSDAGCKLLSRTQRTRNTLSTAGLMFSTTQSRYRRARLSLVCLNCSVFHHIQYLTLRRVG